MPDLFLILSSLRCHFRPACVPSSSLLQGRDGFPDQALHRDVVVMRRVGPAELDDHEVVGGDDNRVLALAADGHEAVGGEACGDTRARGGGVAALGPEARAVAVFVGA